MNAENHSTIRYYVAILRRRKLIVALAILVPVCLAIASIAASTKQYRGEAEVILNRESLANEVQGTSDPVAASSDYLTIVQTDADAARSIEVAQMVLRAIPNTGLTPRRFLENSSVTPASNADLLAFAVDNQDPKLAVRLSSEYAKQYTSYSLKRTNSAFDAALSQINQQLAVARSGGNRGLVSSLTDKAEQLKTLEALQTANSYVVQPKSNATVASPKKKEFLALGIIAGLVLAAALVGILEAFDTKVRASDEVEQLLGVPSLARLSPPPPAFRRAVVTLEDPHDPSVEGFRILRASLELRAADQNCKIFMISSSVEAEGKSLTVANLATAAARTGRNVILVDLDLRRPTQNILFGLNERSPGVTDVLRGDVELSAALQEIQLGEEREDLTVPATAGSESTGRLRLLRSGALAADPGETMASDQLARLLGVLRDKADFVFIDTPPILRTGDAMSISRYCDAIVLVARLLVVKRPMLLDLARAVAESPAVVLGCAVTGSHTSSEAGYASGYGYGYYSTPALDEPEGPASAPTGALKD
jgi:succinoglycan biosynthesis transport protein ExoP